MEQTYITTKYTKHALSEAEGSTKFKNKLSEPFVTFVIFVVKRYCVGC